MAKNKESARFALNKEDMSAIGRGALVAIGGAIVTYLMQVIPQVDFGEWTPLVVALSGIVLNAARKYLQGK